MLFLRVSLGKAIAVNATSASAKLQLTSASREIIDSLSTLTEDATKLAPGMAQCDHSIRRINAALALLNQPSTPINTSTYFESVDVIYKESKV